MPEPTQPNNEALKEQFIVESVPVGFPWRLFIFSLVLFAFSILLSLGLTFGYGAYLERRSKSLDNQTVELTKQVSKEAQERLVSFYSQLVNLKSVLERHTFITNTFAFLENHTLPSVYYTEADFLTETRRLTLEGKASSVENLVSQLGILDRLPELEQVVLHKTTVDGASISFEVSLVFKQSAFEKPAL